MEQGNQNNLNSQTGNEPSTIFLPQHGPYLHRMAQAAKNNEQNIAESNQAVATSSKTELKLTEHIAFPLRYILVPQVAEYFAVPLCDERRYKKRICQSSKNYRKSQKKLNKQV